MASGGAVATPPPIQKPPKLPNRANGGVQQSLIDDINRPSSDVTPEEKPTPKSEEQGPKGQDGSTPGLIAGIILIVASPMLVIFGAVLGVSRASNANPGGATLPQNIEVSHPSAELTNLLNTFSSASDTQSYLTKGTTLLDTYTTNLTLLQTKIQANDPAYSSIKDKAGVLALIPQMLEQVATLKADVSGGQKEKLTADAKAFKNMVSQLNTLVGPDIATLALSYAQENENSGYTKYRYSQDGRDQFFYNKTGTSDCSSFVSAMWYWSGYTRVSVTFTTVSMYDAAKKNQYGLSIVAESTTSDGLSDDTVRSLIKPGDALLSAGVPFSEGGDDQRHAVLYIGNNQVVESTNANGKNGIQVDTLDSRLRRKSQVIIRPGGAQ
jgi:hypothetical protein